jgi:hypothetical protein
VSGFVKNDVRQKSRISSNQSTLMSKPERLPNDSLSRVWLEEFNMNDHPKSFQESVDVLSE